MRIHVQVFWTTNGIWWSKDLYKEKEFLFSCLFRLFKQWLKDIFIYFHFLSVYSYHLHILFRKFLKLFNLEIFINLVSLLLFILVIQNSNFHISGRRILLDSFQNIRAVIDWKPIYCISFGKCVILLWSSRHNMKPTRKFICTRLSRYNR
jgi:hypothetical protein